MSRNKQPGIYRITVPKIRGAYIGRSTDVPRRWGSHRRELREGRHSNDFLQAAWKLYGEDAFEWSVVRSSGWFLAFFEKYYWTLEKMNPRTIVYNEVKPSKGARRWWMVWRKQ